MSHIYTLRSYCVLYVLLQESSFLLGKFWGREVTWRKWRALIYSYEQFFMPEVISMSFEYLQYSFSVVIPPSVTVLIQSYFIHYPNTASGGVWGRGQVKERLDSLWHMTIAFFSYRKGMVWCHKIKSPLQKPLFIMEQICTQVQNTYIGPQIKGALKSLNPDFTYLRNSDYVSFVKHPQCGSHFSATSNS